LKKSPARYSILYLVMFIMLIGCGFKTNPVSYPVIADKKPVIDNLEALAGGEAVVLKWNFRDKSGVINYISIERSEVGTPGNECKNCPRTFQRIGQIPVKEEMPAKSGQTTLSYTDANVVKGRIYSYRLMLCAKNGDCSPASTAEINFQ
jgi:hypothetical protein